MSKLILCLLITLVWCQMETVGYEEQDRESEQQMIEDNKTSAGPDNGSSPKYDPNANNEDGMNMVREEVEKVEDTLDDALENFLGHKQKPIHDMFSLIAPNDTRPITHENFPTFSEARLKREIYIREQKKLYRYDYTLGPLHTSPYAGGSLFPEYETLTVKPGFKIWVDGGTLDYPDHLCLAKKLNCSATCCKQSYCAAEKKDCIVYTRRSFNEIYVGMLVMSMISFGIPTCFLSAEVILNFKFFREYNEDADAHVGGYTFLEGITYGFTLGRSSHVKLEIRDTYEYEYLNDKHKHDEECIDGNLKKQKKKTLASMQAAPLPDTNLQADAKQISDPGKLGIGQLQSEPIMDIMNDSEPLPMFQTPIPLPKQKNCFHRLCCLIFCCKTKDIGSLANMKISEQELQFLHKEMTQEMNRRETLKRGVNSSVLSSAGAEPIDKDKSMTPLNKSAIDKSVLDKSANDKSAVTASPAKKEDAPASSATPTPQGKKDETPK